MLRRVRIDYPGESQFLHSELVDRLTWEAVNEKMEQEGKEIATAESVLLGVTKVSLSTESFLAASSFQETTRVLTEAALFGKVDMLQGLKENVIIGRLIPAQLESQIVEEKQQAAAELAALMQPEEGEEETSPERSKDDEDGLRALAALLNSSLDGDNSRGS